jgi:phage I-like protein
MKLFRLDQSLASAQAAEKKDTAKWCQLFPLGTFHRWDFPNGKIVVDAAFCAAIVANWEKAGKPELPVDYFHRGESDQGPTPVQEKVASGWIVSLMCQPDGLHAAIKWTDRARAHILADELRYLSPTFATDGFDRKSGKPQGPTLFGAGLLNDPYFAELPRVAASSSTPNTTAEKAQLRSGNMDPKQIRLALGLAEDASDEAVTARLTELNALELKAKETEKLELANGEAKKALVIATDALKAQAEQSKLLASRVEKLEAEKKDKELDDLVAEIRLAKRVLPAKADSVKQYALALGIAAAREFFMALPAVIQTGELGTTGEVETTDKASATKKLAAAADELSKKHGLSGTEAMRRAAKENKELAEKASLTN